MALHILDKCMNTPMYTNQKFTFRWRHNCVQSFYIHLHVFNCDSCIKVCFRSFGCNPSPLINHSRCHQLARQGQYCPTAVLHGSDKCRPSCIINLHGVQLSTTNEHLNPLRPPPRLGTIRLNRNMPQGQLLSRIAISLLNLPWI